MTMPLISSVTERVCILKDSSGWSGRRVACPRPSIDRLVDNKEPFRSITKALNLSTDGKRRVGASPVMEMN